MKAQHEYTHARTREPKQRLRCTLAGVEAVPDIHTRLDAWGVGELEAEGTVKGQGDSWGCGGRQ